MTIKYQRATKDKPMLLFEFAIQVTTIPRSISYTPCEVSSNIS